MGDLASAAGDQEEASRRYQQGLTIPERLPQHDPNNPYHRLDLTVSHNNLCYFFFTATAPTEIYTLSLHDALPISLASPLIGVLLLAPVEARVEHHPADPRA